MARPKKTAANNLEIQEATPVAKKRRGKKAPKTSAKKAAKKSAIKTRGIAESTRTRKARPYPASSFKDALQLGEAIMNFASGDKVRRLTLLEKMAKSPSSSTTVMMITNSGKYGITTGSYAAEHLQLTDQGRIAVDSTKSFRERKQASFDLAIDGIPPFKLLYDHYKDKRLPEREVMKDVLKDSDIDVPDLDECVDTFTVNVKDLDLLRTIGGAETLVSVNQVIEELPKSGVSASTPRNSDAPTPKNAASLDNPEWDKICFYITPIGTDDSEERKHSDLFLSHLVQPALEELGLTVIRADQIGEAGMITTQVLRYLKHSRLAVADLSYLNPSVLYEVALRHGLKLPTVQIIRKQDRLPFDVKEVRTVTIDTTDIYSLVPKLQTYRAEIATQSRKALEDPESIGNPVSIFFPDFFK